MASGFQSIEADLDRAVLERRYADIRRLAQAFCDCVEAEARSLGPGDPRLAELAARAQHTLHNGVARLTADRAMLAAQLAQVPAVKRFLDGDGRTPNLRLDG